VARDLGGRTFLLLTREGDPARRGKLGRELRRAGHRRRCRAAVRRFLVLVRVPAAAPGDGERRGRDDEDRCKGAPAHGAEAYKCAHRIAPPTSATAPRTATRTIVRVSPPPEDRPATAATGDPSTVRYTYEAALEPDGSGESRKWWYCQARATLPSTRCRLASEGIGSCGP